MQKEYKLIFPVTSCVDNQIIEYLFLSFQFQHPTDEFKFATSRDTSIEMFFKSSPNPQYNRMYYFMKKYNVNSTDEGLNKTLQGYV